MIEAGVVPPQSFSDIHFWQLGQDAARFGRAVRGLAERAIS
ncbi:hypothetical protein IMCC26207_103137 [Actinobacteria bacterium IMCC26207]|nr:hypothetical protein IMCC26207_103137 [Actinobacteria bacterium IMCC26207]